MRRSGRRGDGGGVRIIRRGCRGRKGYILPRLMWRAVLDNTTMCCIYLFSRKAHMLDSMNIPNFTKPRGSA